jgi:hypothetical protein
MKKKLLIISDGNGVSTDFKKWPALLEVLCVKTLTVVNRSVIGASNELMLMQLAEAVQQDHYDYAVVQWSGADRIDLVADEFWIDQAKQDPVYHFNLVESNQKTWWVTSKSQNAHVKEYHSKYIRRWQAQQRSQAFMLSAAELLKFHQVPFGFSLCYNFEFLDPYQSILETYPWIWHSNNSGISEYRTQSKHSHLDQGLSQPHTLIQLDWIDQVLRPACEIIDYSQEVYYNVEQALIKNV